MEIRMECLRLAVSIVSPMGDDSRVIQVAQALYDWLHKQKLES